MNCFQRACEECCDAREFQNLQIDWSCVCVNHNRCHLLQLACWHYLKPQSFCRSNLVLTSAALELRTVSNALCLSKLEGRTICFPWLMTLDLDMAYNTTLGLCRVTDLFWLEGISGGNLVLLPCSSRATYSSFPRTMPRLLDLLSQS